jgi:type I restriction-modification system DNA methylase subunit
LRKIEDQKRHADVFIQYDFDQLKVALQQLELLGHKYHCIADNPPYMGGGNMNAGLSEFVKINYPDSKADLMTCFMESSLQMLFPKGYLGMINLPSWLFLSSFTKLREKIIKEKHIDSLLHMGRGIFGVDWGSTSFIICNQQLHYDARFFRL